ncbi:MAG: hypothetical protein ACK4S2_01825 [Gemmobacter sp.]|uniref:hypothetical protein n=1 Tax=Gemmobacter sp. TaxID=1898957 RepID=UPI003918C5A9
MTLTIHRTARGTAAAALNLALTGLSGVILLGNQWVAAEPSVVGAVAGVLMLAWAGLILSALLRPVLLVADDAGLSVRRVLGWHRFAWPDLLWADLQGSRAVLFAARAGGRDRYAALPRRPVAPEDFDRLSQTLRQRRPDLPLKNPATPTLPEAA